MPRRVDRVNELLRSEISYLIARQIKDPRVAGVISITEVVASNDLRSARVFVSVMGHDDDRREALEGIRSAASFLRRELRERVNLRHTPHLIFQLDDSIEEGDRGSSADGRPVAGTVRLRLPRACRAEATHAIAKKLREHPDFAQVS